MEISRQGAWSGFYKAVKVVAECQREVKKGNGHAVQSKWKMADMRAKRFAKILVDKYNWQDIHTEKYCVKL